MNVWSKGAAEPAMGSEDKQPMFHAVWRKKRTYSYQRFVLDSVLFDWQRQDCESQWTLSPSSIILWNFARVYITRKKEQSAFWKKLLQGRSFQSDVDVVQEVQQIFDLIPRKNSPKQSMKKDPVYGRVFEKDRQKGVTSEFEDECSVSDLE